MKQILITFFLLIACAAFAQTPLLSNPYSTESAKGFVPCMDTITIFKKRQYYDIGMMLPSWLPVVNKNYTAVLEGRVEYNPPDGTDGPHISGEDLPFCHYSHDVDFDVLPDKTPDNRFTNLLAVRIYEHEMKHKHKRDSTLSSSAGTDTTLQRSIHCEWECGLGMANRGNPIFADNDIGRSGGFFSAGHEMGDIIWNWPACGDWVHLEGELVWDRGHPPSRTELHPPRFAAIKRALPEQVIIGDSSVKFATRVDIFASGDGSPFDNNRFNTAPFVRRVNMSDKDYSFTVKVDMPRPSAKAHLRYKLTRHKADSFSAYELIDMNDDSSIAHVTIPWMTKNANDVEIYARTLDFYWDEGNGAPANAPVDIYKVTLNGIHFKHLDELFTKAEVRLFANVGNEWIFVNDFFAKKGKILSKGLGKTYKHKWNLNNQFTVCVPRGKSFRVYMAGWEVDGVDALFGDLVDPYSPCNQKTRHFIKSRVFSSAMVARGCYDDDYGETSRLHNYDNMGKVEHFTNSPQQGMNNDPCPFSKYPLKDRVFLSYTIEKVN